MKNRAILIIIADRILDLLLNPRKRESVETPLSRPKTAIGGLKPHELVSEINNIYWMPHPQNVEKAKELVETGWITKGQVKGYLAGDWN